MKITLKKADEFPDVSTSNFKNMRVEAGIHEFERISLGGVDWYVLAGTKVGAIVTYFDKLVKKGEATIEEDPLFSPDKETRP